MAKKKLKAVIVGCGQIADAHLQELGKVPCAEVVGVCDRHLDLARQAAARFGVRGVYTDLGAALAATSPDVVHITTPPHTHADIARQALDAGAHVYIEKPFTVDAAEARALLRDAEAKGRRVCVGHDQLFDPAWDRVRRLVQRGDLGRVVHIDSYLGYNLDGPFGRVLTTDPNHWVLRLPGGLFQNTISHALYKITDFLADERPRVLATWFRGPTEAPFPTELRAMIHGADVTANLVFSCRMRPAQRVVRVHGTRGSVEVDFDSQVVRRFMSGKLPGAFSKIEVPGRQVREAAGSLARSLWRFLRSDIHYFAGMQRLFALFYQAILEGRPSPIPAEEIYRVTAVMDEIFRVCREDSGQPGSPSEHPGRNGMPLALAR